MASTSVNATLQFQMISIPVGLRLIKADEDVRIERATLGGEKAVQKLFAPEAEIAPENVLGTEDFQYGVFDTAGTFKPIPADAIKEIEEATKLDTFEIQEFIPATDIPWERGLKTYYLAPQRGKSGAGAAKAMALVLAGMREAKLAGVMKICLSKRQYLAVLHSRGQKKRLYVTLMAWAEDWKRDEDADVLDGVAVDRKAVEMAVQLMRSMVAPDTQAALDTPVDDLRVEKAKLVEAALAGKAVKAKAKKAAAPVSDGLMEQLQASLALAGAR